jgi:hypothetical protein
MGGVSRFHRGAAAHWIGAATIRNAPRRKTTVLPSSVPGANSHRGCNARARVAPRHRAGLHDAQIMRRRLRSSSPVTQFAKCLLLVTRRDLRSRSRRHVTPLGSRCRRRGECRGFPPAQLGFGLGRWPLGARESNRPRTHANSWAQISAIWTSLGAVRNGLPDERAPR